MDLALEGSEAIFFFIAFGTELFEKLRLLILAQSDLGQKFAVDQTETYNNDDAIGAHCPIDWEVKYLHNEAVLNIFVLAW